MSLKTSKRNYAWNWSRGERFPKLLFRTC